MRRLKNIFLVLAVIGIVTPIFVFADEFGVQDAAQGTRLIGAGSSVNASTALPELIGTVVGVVLSFVGVIFFLLILYAGIMWMTAFGNDQKVERSKEIIISAAIGLVIVLAAYAISRFVFSALSGATTSSSSVNGCCSNYETGNRIQTLQENCSGPTRTWAAGSCPSTGLGCCSNSATGNSVSTFEEACSGATRTWTAGPCS